MRSQYSDYLQYTNTNFLRRICIPIPISLLSELSVYIYIYIYIERHSFVVKDVRAYCSGQVSAHRKVDDIS